MMGDSTLLRNATSTMQDVTAFGSRVGDALHSDSAEPLAVTVSSTIVLLLPPTPKES
jgi:hypothetical protein